MDQHTAQESSSTRWQSAGAEVLLTTKLNIPSTRTNLVTRPRLIGRLDEGIGGKLTLVCAPAGFGKSTLLGDWILRCGLPVGWISLDNDDNDPARFLAYLAAALQTAAPDIGARSLLDSPRPPTRALLTDLVNEAATVPNDFALVLDDYHLIEDEAVHAALAFLLEHLPPQMRLVVASRAEPPLPLARMLARGHLTRLTAKDLRFTPEETASFLNEAMGLDLPAEAITALEERTEGWIAGLQLAALSMRGRKDVSGFVAAFAGTNRHIFEYLAEEVLDRQTKDTREFLLRTSILDRLSGPLCDAVTERDDGQAMLEQLERMNLQMVPLDEWRRWYRYHHLFSDFLRERLRRENPEMVSELHGRASTWLEENGTASEAIAHALASGDFERAGIMIEVLSDTMYGHGEYPAIDRLMEALPAEVIRSRPLLYLAYVITTFMVGDRWNEAEAPLRDLEQKLGIGGEGDFEEPEDGNLARVAGDIATMRANIAYEGRGDLPVAIALNRRALELLADDEYAPARGTAACNLAECLLDIGDLPAARIAIDESIEVGRVADHRAEVGWSMLHLGRLQTIQGHLSEGMQTYERILRLTTGQGEPGLLLDIGTAHVRIGELLFEWDDLEAATCHLLEGIEYVLEWTSLGDATSRLLDDVTMHDRLGTLDEVDPDAAHGVVPGYIALARVKQAQGDTDGAFEALRNVEIVARNSRISPLWKGRAKNWGEAWQARIHLANGELRTPARWAKDRELSASDDPDYSAELEYITLARLLLA